MRCGRIQRKENKEISPEFSHAIIFVFDSAEISTFNIIADYIEAYLQIEESKHANIDKKTNDFYRTKKVII